MKVVQEKKSDGVKVDHEKRSDGVRKFTAWVKVHHDQNAMGWEFTIRKSDGVRVHHKKKRWGESLL